MAVIPNRAFAQFIDTKSIIRDMKLKYKTRRGFTLVELLVVIAIIATLAGVGVPVIIAQKKRGDRNQATQNAKSVGLALFLFENDYGSFPSAGGDNTTDKQVLENTSGSSNTYTFGTTNSNDYFRQLIAAGSTDSERIFYAKAAYTKKPDSNIQGQKCIAAGECGFAYLMASATEPLSSAGNSGRPIAAASVKDAGTDGRFDMDIYGERKAVVLKMDQSAEELTIRPSDMKVSMGSGKTLLDGGSDDTVWGKDVTPIMKAPSKASGGT